MPNLYQIAVGLLGLGFGFLHRWHVSTLFENDRHFSHLSEIEREMSFRTEMGMYYSYYKTIVESENFFEGWKKITHDNTNEYGTIVNAPAKYNLLPEIVSGFLYHVAKDFRLIGVDKCWQIERGSDLPPVTSCEGLGVPVYFYLEFVWLLSIVTVAVLFYYATFLSNSVCGGLIATLLFFYNHDECTRVQWTPPLRESFAYPMLLCQMYKVTMIVRKPPEDISWHQILDGWFYTGICLYSWQFSQYVFVTQIIALRILRWLDIVTPRQYSVIILIHMFAVLTTNAIFELSLYTSFLWPTFLFQVHGDIFSQYLGHRVVLFLHLLEIPLTISLLKCYQSAAQSEDGAHIFNLLKSKLTDYKDFHTMLYTCSPEFDFLQYKTYEVIIKTLLLPIAILAGMLALYYWYRNFKLRGFPKCIEPDIAYNALQTGAFILMAIFIMRLKLFMNPHLCIIAGLVCAKRYLEKVGIKNELTRGAIVVLLIAGMSHYGIERFQDERSIIGEYSNFEQEELFEWIKHNTPENAVFAGKMSLMANVMLSTRRPVVNNPYYESKDMRERTMKVYEIFSRKDPAAVYVTLIGMRINYVVLDEPLCLGYAHLKPGCQMVDLWDIVDNGTAKASGSPPLCPILFKGNEHPFKRVFENEHFVVLQLDYSHYTTYKPKIPTRLSFQF